MKTGKLEILYEDNHLLAVNKPAGLATMGVAAGMPSVVTLAKQYIKARYRKPGNVYLGVVSRLDTGTTGVLVLARTSKAAARLTEQFREHQVRKTYWAVVSGRFPLADPTAEPIWHAWTDWLAKNDAAARMEIVRASQPGAQQAELRCRAVRVGAFGTMVEVELKTGRKHQIRVQLAARGFPVLGETKYAKGTPFAAGLALHARQLEISHPVKHEPMQLIAPLPPSWRRLGIEA